HQTIIIAIGYPLIQSGWFGIYGEAGLITVATFGLCFLLHEFVIRRVPLLRLLFGLRWTPKKTPPHNSEATNPFPESYAPNPASARIQTGTNWSSPLGF
ncbi:MAG TPA: hypothetical protein VD713_00405, partial [Sphingomonadales bacterium]|nr:hypothetical protein [Sphingomonadales bacterium]